MLQWPPPTSSQSSGPSRGCLAASAAEEVPRSSPGELPRLDAAIAFVCTFEKLETTVRQSVSRRRYGCAGRAGSKVGSELERCTMAASTALGERCAGVASTRRPAGDVGEQMRRPAGVSSRPCERRGRDEHEEGDAGAETDAETGDRTEAGDRTELGRARRRLLGASSSDCAAFVTRVPSGDAGGLVLGSALVAGSCCVLGWPPAFAAGGRCVLG